VLKKLTDAMRVYHYRSDFSSSREGIDLFSPLQNKQAGSARKAPELSSSKTKSTLRVKEFFQLILIHPILSKKAANE
jgi:hypothetical protein